MRARHLASLGSFGGVIVELSLVMIPSHFKISPNDGVIGSEAEARGVVVKVMIFVSSPHQPDCS